MTTFTSKAQADEWTASTTAATWTGRTDADPTASAGIATWDRAGVTWDQPGGLWET